MNRLEFPNQQGGTKAELLAENFKLKNRLSDIGEKFALIEAQKNHCVTLLIAFLKTRGDEATFEFGELEAITSETRLQFCKDKERKTLTLKIDKETK